jgi:hypothetical protein
MTTEDARTLSEAKYTGMVTASSWSFETPEEKVIRLGKEEKRFKEENDFRWVDGELAHREKGTKGIWRSKDGRIFCSCGNGQLQIFSPEDEYETSFKCKVCGYGEVVHSG